MNTHTLRKESRRRGFHCMDRQGFIYAGRSLGSNVVKIGFTTRRDPSAYVVRRYAGLLEIENLMAVSNAPDAERLVHHSYRDYRHKSFRSRELFTNLPPPHEIQETFCWAAQLVNHPEQLREYANLHGILLEGDSHRVTCKLATFDEDDG